MQLYVDGGCEGNEQRDITKRRMVMVVTDSVGVVLSEETANGGSNNIAELCAVRNALQWCVDHDVTIAEVLTDSRNNLSWVNGHKVGKAINDRGTVLRLKDEIGELRTRVALTLLWIPREGNKAGHYIERVYAC